MKKIFMLMVTVLMCISMSAQSVVKTEDGKYDVYCKVEGYNLFGVGKLKVMLDMGYNTENKNSLFDENNKKIKFNSMMEVLDYMSKRGWKLVNTYYLTASTKQDVVNFILKKRVSKDEEKTEGLNIQSEK